MLCDRLIAKTDVLHRTYSQAAGTRPPSSQPFLSLPNEEEKMIHGDSTRQHKRNPKLKFLRGDSGGYFNTKDSAYI